MISVRRLSPNCSRISFSSALMTLSSDALVGEDVPQPGDVAHQVDQLLEELLALHAGERCSRMSRMFLRLLLAEARALVLVREAGVGRLLGCARGDQRVHLRLRLARSRCRGRSLKRSCS